MGRIIGIVIGLVIILAVGAGLYGYLRGSELLRSSVERYGPEYTGGSVRLADVDFSLLDSSGSLTGLEIGNPPGYEAERAFALNRIFLDLEGQSLFGDVVRIRQLRIEEPELFVELKGKRTNIQAIQENIAAAAGAAEESQSTKDIIIDRLSITAPTIRIVAGDLGLSEQSLTLADIEMTDIGTEQGGIPPADAVRLVMDVITPQVTRALASQKGQELLSRVGADPGTIRERLQDKAEEKIKEGLGGLLGKKKDDDGGN